MDYSYGIYMVHLPLRGAWCKHSRFDAYAEGHDVESYFVDPASLLCCWIIARLRAARKWMLAVK